MPITISHKSRIDAEEAFNKRNLLLAVEPCVAACCKRKCSAVCSAKVSQFELFGHKADRSYGAGNKIWWRQMDAEALVVALAREACGN